MKIVIYFLISLAFAMLVYNASLLDFSNLLEGNSLSALIAIVLSICAILILLIFSLSKKIEEKTKN